MNDESNNASETEDRSISPMMWILFIVFGIACWAGLVYALAYILTLAENYGS